MTRGVTSLHALFGRAGLYTAFLGGMGAEHVLEWSDEEIMETARVDFRAVTGADAEPLLAHRTWMPAWDTSFEALDDLDAPSGLWLMGAYRNRPGILGRLAEAGALARHVAASGS